MEFTNLKTLHEALLKRGFHCKSGCSIYPYKTYYNKEMHWALVKIHSTYNHHRPFLYILFPDNLSHQIEIDNMDDIQNIYEKELKDWAVHHEVLVWDPYPHKEVQFKPFEFSMWMGVPHLW